MSRVVQKYGGSSVADVEKIRKVAAKVKARHDAGSEVVVVVSAMGDTTDDLLQLARSVAADPPRRELDMLLTCGERISMALLSMALQELKVPAISFTGSQSGIITDESHAQARIVEVRPTRIIEELERGRVVIVAGYQGVSRQKEVTTLGRGGSDTSAVALAAALGADCEIYSDVDGIFSADPRLVPSARKLDEISHLEMQELAAAGAKVLNAQAVEHARDKGITLYARSTHSAGSGTAIRDTPQPRESRVRAVTSDAELWVLRGELRPALEVLDALKVKGRTLSLEGTRGVLLVNLQDVHGPQALTADLQARGIEVQEGLGTVTCVGTGLNADWSIVRRSLAIAGELGTEVVGVHVSAAQVTLLVARQGLSLLTRRLHDEWVC